MDETIDWLRDRPYYDGQIRDHRVVPGRDPSFRAVELESRLAGALSDRGIDGLYEHQAAAVDAVRDGSNVVVATRTASGKSLAYTVPAFERAMDRGATTLYVAPQVALINDQTDTLSDIAHGLGFGSRVDVAQYTGRQSQSGKRSIRDRRPTVLLTTPDMLHFGILPHAHRLWDWFVSRLETVVVDEVHEYRGVFGSHVALVFRRLQRLCDRFDADPDWVCCSATIGNPVEHAATVTARPESSFTLVDEDTSATGPRHWLFWNPPTHGGRGHGERVSNHVETKRLFVDLVSKGYQTVAFTSARQTAERYATDSADSLRERGFEDEASRVTAYQAALTQDRRDDIEADLHSGELLGVWSTSALELGVDVGGLDAVLLDGYPGTRMSAFQRAGRAGRGTDPALVALVAGEDQLDQFFVADPVAFFDGDPERAVSNPENDQLLPDHVCAAARENWLSTGDEAHFGETFPDVVADLESAGRLERRDTANGTRWTYGGDGSPQHEMNLRTIDDREVRLMDVRSNDVVATLSFADALRDAHPGAIYHQQGRTYEVTDFDFAKDVARLSPTWADYYTRTLHEKDITVERVEETRTLDTHPDVTVGFAEVTMRKQITGFERRDSKTGESLGSEPLDVPETSLATRGLYFTVPDAVEEAMREAASHREREGPASADFAGGIHAAEHALISMFPLEVLCDRRDVGGVSTPLHRHTGQATIFVYDGYPGGVGLTRSVYPELESLMGSTVRMLVACECENGCPACVQSPHCGNANDPLDKHLGAHLLASLAAPSSGD